ncbi:MAG: dihydropteroate synthase, partial [Pseudomonadota bacterium]|nr:dihydropteroate synthase [Pseudomonadota bacterium]
MGILNVTPDSFSDGGRYLDVSAAIQRAREMVAEGADIIDIGGESTRPGARPVTLEQELKRVIPIVRQLAADLPVPLSVDTSRPEVMQAAAEAGAGMINDVRALREPGAMATALELRLPVCLMHMQGEPATMQDDPSYEDVVGEVHAFLSERLACCQEAGICRTKVLVDPGFGFGKTPEHNQQILERLDSYL